MSAANAPVQRAERLLTVILNLVALHSFGVGLALILRPAFLMEWAGFPNNSEAFFTVQNGVFHIVLAVGYVWAGWQPLAGRRMIAFVVVVKSMAAVFLLLYYSLVDARFVILMSGIGDSTMAVVVGACLRRLDLAERGGRRP